MLQKIATDVAKAAPVAGTVVWLDHTVAFINAYGSALVTVLGIVYGVITAWLRIRELLDKYKKDKANVASQ